MKYLYKTIEADQNNDKKKLLYFSTKRSFTIISNNTSKDCIRIICYTNRLRQLHPSGSCVNSNKMLINSMHFRNAHTRDDDHLILLIKSGKAHEKKMLP